MRILILGGSGMLGHKIFQCLRVRFPETACTLRASLREASLESVELFRDGTVFEGVEAGEMSRLDAVLAQFQPQVIVNCIGLIKQRAEARSYLQAMIVNAIFPRLLADAAAKWGARLIHISTDCVFDGCRGGYVEQDRPDAQDPYGVSKQAGEVIAPHVLVLRTSFIGRELSSHASLLEWFLASEGGTVRGYTHAIFSGITSNYLGRILPEIIEKHADLSGLYHFSASPISKYELLVLLRNAFGLNVEIVPDDTLHRDRSLNGSAFKKKTGIAVPTWPELTRELALDTTPYPSWRNAHETA